MTQIVFGAIGGLALFLYGMQLGGDGLQKAAGSALKNVLYRLTKNRILGVIMGIIVTVLMQSSSATTVMLVGLVRAQLMTLEQTIGVILGADIGTTLTVQLIAFKITDVALLLVGVGFLVMFTAKKSRTRFIGQVILGFGFIFYGMYIMSETMKPLRDYAFFRDLLASLSGNPFLGLFVSTVFTGIIQSSAATIGLVLSLALQGIMPLEAAVPLIFGANIGTAATALLASIGSPLEAKRVAVAHVTFKVLGVVIFFPLLKPFTALVLQTSDYLPRQIANAHTIFNVGMTIVFLPFTVALTRFVRFLVKGSDKEMELATPAYLDNAAVGNASLALQQAEQELLRVAGIVESMLADSYKVLEKKDEKLLEDILRREDAVDKLFRAVSTFLTSISERTLTDQDSKRSMQMLYAINDLEHIGDVVANILHLASKTVVSNLSFSEQGRDEIRSMHSDVTALLHQAVEAFQQEDTDSAQNVVKQVPAIKGRERNLRQSHIARLRAGLEYSRATSSIHLDIINGFERIADHAASIAQTVLGDAAMTAGSEAEVV